MEEDALRAALVSLMMAVETLGHTSPGEECPTCVFELHHDALLQSIRKLLKEET